MLRCILTLKVFIVNSWHNGGAVKIWRLLMLMLMLILELFRLAGEMRGAKVWEA